MSEHLDHPAIQANIKSIGLASKGKKDEWLALYAEDAVVQDPVGVSPFDPTGEGHKGKAAIDVIGNPLGKSGGSFIQQILIVTFGSLAASTPYLAGILAVICFMWLRAAVRLDGLIKARQAETGAVLE